MLDLNNPDASKVILSDIQDKISVDGVINDVNGVECLKAMKDNSLFKGLNKDELKARFIPYHKLIRDMVLIKDTSVTANVEIEENVRSFVDENSDSGEDIIVGVIDSGVWTEIQSFKDDVMTKEIPSKWKGACEAGQEFNASMCNFKLIEARYFNKGNCVNGASYFGCAKGVARGIAPKSRLDIYKFNWKEGLLAYGVLAGMGQAIMDSVDGISISMRFDDVPLYEDHIAITSITAMEKGIIVSSSAGNLGLYLGTLHKDIPWLIIIVLGTIDRTFGTLVLGNGKNIIGWTLFA
ncbi:hypothetical protein RYX36_033993 [Vicia faba]